MARMRSGSTTGYAVATVIFVILFVFSLISAIFLYTMVDKHRENERVATERLRSIVTKPQEDNLRSQPLRPNETIVGQLQTDLEALKSRVVGSTNATMDAITAELRSIDVLDKGPLVQEIRRLRAEKASDEARLVDAEAALADAQKALAEAHKLRAADKGEHDRAVDQLRAQLESVTSQVGAFQENFNTQSASLASQLETVRREKDQQVATLRSSLDQKDREIDTLRSRMRETQDTTARGGDTVVIDPSTQPDGQIAAILSEQRMVYIDRGHNNNIPLGITFEVFDKTAGITKDDSGEVRGKATIEVVNVLQNSAVARVVRSTRGQTINEGDVIVNAVYDPNVKYKFVVFGEFDIDAVGQPSVGDRRRIETLIEQYGGSVTPELTYDTDFLVLSEEPRLPEPLKPGEIDQERIAQHAADTRRYNTYQELVNRARELKIPILNQNRFLALVGYYRR